MPKSRFRALASLLTAVMLLAFSVGSASAASPKASFTFSICQATIDSFDGDGNPITLQAIEFLYSWSGARVDNVSGSWTRSDGQPVLFGFDDSDFAGARSGSVDAGSLTIMDDPGFDGLVGAFQVNRHVLFSQAIPEPAGGWTSVPAC
ncbi:MAG TPA: hypothetical protein VFW20_01275 [Candidatus Limnocylindrales bacterium]|nr:hypothetical protein [Candidatus Limnocylindrales bacterium]